MPDLNYNSYLHDKVDSKFSSKNTFTSRNTVISNSRYVFIYTLHLNEMEIVKQARMFAENFVATGKYRIPLNDTQNRSITSKAQLSDIYLYSYVKSLFYSINKVLNSGSSYFPANNFVFKGHKLLYDNILSGSMSHFHATRRTTVTYQIDVDNDMLVKLSDFECFKRFYNNNLNTVYDDLCEGILNYLSRYADDVLCIEKMNSHISMECYDTALNPLGNACISSDLNSLRYVECQFTSTDLPSFYWNKACLITEKVIQPVDVNNSIYDDSEYSELDAIGLSDEVHSITGFSPFVQSVIDYNYGRDFDNGPTYPSDPDSSGYDRDPVGPDSVYKTSIVRGGPGAVTPRNPRKRYSVQKRSKPSKKGPKTGFLVSVSDVTRNIFNFISHNQDIINRDNVNIVAEALSVITNRTMTLKDKLGLVGLTVRRAFLRFNVPKQVFSYEHDDPSLFISNSTEYPLLVEMKKSRLGTKTGYVVV